MTLSPKARKPDLPWLDLPDPEAWEAWLEANHASSDGVWLILGKKGAPTATPRRAEALDLALRFGWIDGQVMAIDAHYWRQRYTPRAPRSKWSRINRDRVTELVELGLMRPAGLAEVDRAKADGRWEAAYAPPSRAVVPDELRAALAANPEVQARFATLSSANRYAFLYRIENAKRPETRAKWVAECIRMLAAGQTFH